MGSIPQAGVSFAERVVDQLRGWPALSVCRVDCGGSRGLALSTRQIVHLHSANEAELYLTWPVIQRMHEVLVDSERVMLVPGEDWVRVRLDGDSDVRLFTSLVSVAIQANSAAVRECHQPVAPCPKHRLTSV
ncbi:luciferase family protein [Actinomadura sp. HBU206391]|uniref:luciferase domain-containing protein n=1 Tax=Actinomadura sp. HBU206391 TaxID=2731692 RepID=UPI00164FB1A6|nr:luciferase family protein [Actinomadura sp. HBU206391]MBC6459464.1 DUF5519 family protein [Actinomadura sp. HBU206391]